MPDEPKETDEPQLPGIPVDEWLEAKSIERKKLHKLSEVCPLCEAAASDGHHLLVAEVLELRELREAVRRK